MPRSAKIKSIRVKMLQFFVAAFLAIITTRFLEYLYIKNSHFIDSLFLYTGKGLLFDMKLLVLILFSCFPFFFLSKYTRLKRAWIFADILLFVFIVLNVSLSFYFGAILEPLDKTVFNHSIGESLYVVKEFGAFSFWFLLIALPPIVYIVARRKLRKKFQHPQRAFIAIVVFALISLASGYGLTPDRTNYDYSKPYFIVSNKTAYLFSTTLEAESNNTGLTLQQAIKHYQELHGKDYIETEYPLLHRKPPGSTLAPFFKSDVDSKPNLVFIITESLSAAYYGPEAKEFSLTPFLDKLSKKSLVFQNMISVGERTFSIFPSAFGSLPHGERGFSNTKYNMPYHQSVLSLLVDQGYHSTFFYGGHARYGYYDVFHKHQGVKRIYERAEYNYEGTGKKLSVDDIPFGVDDKELFKGAIAALDSIGLDTPYVHSYLTLTMHYPFRFEGQDYYKRVVQNQLRRLPEEQREKYSKYLESFSTVRYTDDAIREFFQEYQKRPEFDQTIFVIVGDHRLSSPHAVDELDVYHVPCIIYSPLIERPAVFKAINTHLDIAPSLVSLFEENYGIPASENHHWLGSELDTNAAFRSTRIAEIMLNNTNVEQYLFRDYFYSFGKLYQINPDLSLTRVSDEVKLAEIEEHRAIERMISRYTVQNNKIFPRQGEIELLVEHRENAVYTFDENTEFESLIAYPIDQDYEQLILDLDYPFYTPFTDEDELPVLVVTVKYPGQEEPFWTGYPLRQLLYKEGKHNKVKLNKVLRDSDALQLKKGAELKVYFWNKEMPEKEFAYKKNTVTLSVAGTK